MSEELDLELDLDDFEEGEIVEEEAEELTDDVMEEVAGGKGTKMGTNPKDKYHYKKNFVKRRVKGVVKYDSTAELTLRSAPGGPVMYGYGWKNGEVILINKYTSTWSGNWVFAYSKKNGGAFGYVDKRFIKL